VPVIAHNEPNNVSFPGLKLREEWQTTSATRQLPPRLVARRIAALVLSTDLLSAFLVAWLFLSKLIALIAALIAGRLRHSLLPAVLSALILLAFEIVFLRHLRNPPASRIGNCS
jgi:hypothetical protein